LLLEKYRVYLWLMNRQTAIVTAIVVVLAVIGVVALLQLNRGESQTQQTVTQQEEQQLPESSANKGTIQSLLKQGKNVTCSISYPEGSGSGTVYVAGTKVRGDFTTKVDNKELMSHMINENNTAYVWTDASNQGTKITIDPNQPIPSAPAGAPQSADLNKEVDMNCKNWSVDNSKFTVPTNVTFTDMSELLKKVQGTGTGPMPKLDASICDQITDASAKAACLKSLGN